MIEAFFSQDDPDSQENMVENEASESDIAVPNFLSTTACTPVSAAQVLPAMDGLPSLRVPVNYTVHRDIGVQRVKYGKGGVTTIVAICLVLILITRRLRNLDSGDEFVEIAFIRDGRWVRTIVDRIYLAEPSKFVELQRKGLPVTRSDAGEVLKYLRDFEMANSDIIPMENVSGRLGWHLDDRIFLYGDETYADPEEDLEIDAKFDAGQNHGAAQMAKGLTTKGDLSAWCSLINKLYSYPKVILVLMTAFVSFMLRILGCENFVQDTSGTTSTGKTTLLRLAASVHGNPDIIITSWDCTEVYFEQQFSLFNGLPVFLNDTKLAVSGSNTSSAGKRIAKAIYQVTEGRGKGRGSLEGTRATSIFDIVLITNGEQVITSFTSNDGGTRSRVISAKNSPFGTEDASVLVHEINATVAAHYGHAGRAFIMDVLESRSEWPRWRDQYQDLKQRYCQRAGRDSVASRLSAFYAAIHFTARLVHKAIPELKPTVDLDELFQNLWPEIVLSGAGDADRAAVAALEVYDWCSTHERCQVF